jgi:multidrug resistance protein, MATE family
MAKYDRWLKSTRFPPFLSTCGQNLGAGQPGQAAKSGWQALGLVAGFMIVCSVILLVWAENIIGLLNVEPDLVKTGIVFLRIAVAGYLGMCIVNILQSCVSGAGDTLVPMFISLAMMWIVQLPLAFLLTRFTDLGMFGVRWAIVVSFMVGAIASEGGNIRSYSRYLATRPPAFIGASAIFY